MDRSKFDELMKKSDDQLKEAMEAIKAKQEALSKPGDIAETFLENAKQSEKIQFGFDVVELQRVNLQPNDVLMVTVKNDDLSQESVDALRNQLQYVFPGNKVFVFAMGTNDDVQLKAISQASENSVASCSTVGYCSDCNCGKKEAIENGQNS